MKHQVKLLLFTLLVLQHIFALPDLTTESPYKIEDAQPEYSSPISNSSIQEHFETKSAEITPRVIYTGYQSWKVYLRKNEDSKLLEELGDNAEIILLSGNHSAIDIIVKPKYIAKVNDLFSEENIKYDVLLEDLQKAIDEGNPPVSEETDDRKGHRLTWQAYHRSDDINDFLKYLEETYPELCSVRNIGYSVQGRPLKVLKISNGKYGNKAIWVDGGMHAREWITPATVTYIINYLILNFENEPQYIQNLDWYIAPLMNPDGYEYSHAVDRLWRKNRARSGQCAGTDLNRNFGYRWGGQGASRNPCRETYAGSGPFSEPETAAIQRFITDTQAKWKAYVSFHSYGQYILYPWGYAAAVPPDHKDLESVARKASAAIASVGGSYYTVGPSGNTLYPASGGSDDWAKGSIKMKYTYTIEVRDTGRYGFVLPPHFINPTAKEALAALRVIAEAASQA